VANPTQTESIACHAGGAWLDRRRSRGYGLTMSSESHAPTPQTVLVSRHAAEQYRYRVRPGLDRDAARVELERLRGAGEISTVAPEWLNAAKQAAHDLLLGDAVALPIARQREGWIATTCVTRRTLTPTRRVAKSARKMSLGAGRRARRRTRF
jgi:hypothetical protein